MLRSLFSALLVILAFTQTASAVEPALARISNAQIVGKGVLSYGFWDIYQATLYAPDGEWNPKKPFVLSIRYYRNIKGAAIADRSVREMRGQGFKDEILLAAWHTQMKSIFPDVQNGTILSALYIPGQGTIFYHGNKNIGTIKDEDFSDRFFSIWLDKKTSEPRLRRALLAEK